MRSLVILLVACLHATPLASQTPRASPRLRSVTDVVAYIGTYPCRTRLLRAPVLRQGIMSVLGADSSAYAEHIERSGCGKIEKDRDLVVMDVSQLHVGGYSSLIIVRPSDGAIWVYWLDAPVAINAPSHIYGSRPVPVDVLHGIEQRMNEAWGHVAHFRAEADSVVIEHKP